MLVTPEALSDPDTMAGIRQLKLSPVFGVLLMSQRLQAGDTGPLAEMAELYWCSETPSDEIRQAYAAQVVVRSNPMMLEAVGPAFVVGMVCRHCDGPVSVASRTEARKKVQDIKRDEAGHRLRPWAYSDVCASCVTRIKREEYERAKQDRAQADRRLLDLKTMPYRDYLATPEWRERRDQKLRSAKYRCQVCGGAGQLDVHHRTYERRGFERLSDLTVLCRGCHGLFHEKSRLRDAPS